MPSLTAARLFKGFRHKEIVCIIRALLLSNAAWGSFFRYTFIVEIMSSIQLQTLMLYVNREKLDNHMSLRGSI